MDKVSNMLDKSFPKKAFMEDDFNVDKFLQENCSKLELHKLHSQLGSYIKYLQSIMIDIVNSESNAIVNLSSDLKILQNKFYSLSTPLEELRGSILHVNESIDVNLSNMKYLMKKKDSITLVKSSKRNELRILLLSHKINHILLSHLENNSVEMEVLERSVDQYILLQMYSQHCSSQEFKTQMVQSTEVLMQILNNEFLSFLLKEDLDSTIRCLQMYVIMNTQHAAEQVYRQKVVQPTLLKIINEEFLNTCSGDLRQLYLKIIDFIKIDMKHILTAVNKLQGFLNFNFILNSVWSEVDEQLRLNLSSIYASGNPTVFHQRFKETCEFLVELENCFVNELQHKAFVQHPTFFSHKSQWNLAIYYEIRHLDIVQQLEENLPKHISPTIFCTEKNVFELEPSKYIWESMLRCFDKDVYLPELLDKFWKLNLQIISRFNTWIKFLLSSNLPVIDEFQPTTDGENQSALVNTKTNFLVKLYLDTLIFVEKLKNVFNGGLYYLSFVPQNLQHLFVKCLEEPQAYLQEDAALIEHSIVDLLYAECSFQVKQILQIPRLFRKTNRSVPTSPSPYLCLMSKSAENFYHQYKNILEENILKSILAATHKKIITEYKTLVENVLTSVTKTEESLRRLKKIKTSSDLQDALSAMTDDQKIRLQVQIDVSNYVEEAQKYVTLEEMNQLLALIKDPVMNETQ